MGGAIVQEVNPIGRACEGKIELWQINVTLNFRFGREDARLALHFMCHEPLSKSNHSGQPHSARCGPRHGALKPLFC